VAPEHGTAASATATESGVWRRRWRAMESPTIPAPTTTTSWWEVEAAAEGWDRSAGSWWRRRRGSRRERRWAREDGEPEEKRVGLGYGAEDKATASMIGGGEELERRSGVELNCRSEVVSSRSGEVGAKKTTEGERGRGSWSTVLVFCITRS
jgi:hypothetical protein